MLVIIDKSTKSSILRISEPSKNMYVILYEVTINIITATFNEV
jgi:hypothetical protein